MKLWEPPSRGLWTPRHHRPRMSDRRRFASMLRFMCCCEDVVRIDCSICSDLTPDQLIPASIQITLANVTNCGCVTSGSGSGQLVPSYPDVNGAYMLDAPTAGDNCHYQFLGDDATARDYQDTTCTTPNLDRDGPFTFDAFFALDGDSDVRFFIQVRYNMLFILSLTSCGVFLAVSDKLTNCNEIDGMVLNNAPACEDVDPTWGVGGPTASKTVQAYSGGTATIAADFAE